MLFFAGLLALLSSVVYAAETPKYVFLFIGDGMGPVQRQVSNLAARTADGKDLVMETLPTKGQIHTRSANNETTDSAAAGTALAAGVKTDNGVLGQLPDGTPVDPIAKTLADAGYKVGVITSIGLNHATPAAFYAHAKSRASYNDIAAQVPAGKLNLLIGNGLLSESQKQDEVLAGWKAAGITTVTNLKDAASAPEPFVAILKYPTATAEKRESMPGELANSVSLAISRLQNDKGFFIMTEGAKIDSECHNNKAGEAIDETHAFDRAIKVAYNFYQQHPKDTLIVVTADHETGGMTLHQDRLDTARLLALPGMDGKLNAALSKAGQLTDASAAAAIADVLGITDLTDAERAPIAKAVADKDAGRVVRTAITIAQSRAGITFTTGGHTPTDVPVTAVGASAEDFAGTYDNTEIPKRILKAMLPPPATKP